MYPILYQADGFQIGSYGVCIVLGGAAAWFLLRLLAWRRGGRLFAFDDLTYAFMMCVAGGFTGAFLFRPITRIPELLFRWSEIRELPLGVVMNLLFGEVVFYGGLIGGFIALFLFCRGFKLEMLPFLDIAAPAVALGHAFGRVGCFLGGCCYGVHVDASHPLAVRFPEINAGGAPAGVPLLPVQLIEASGLIIIAAALTLAYIIIYISKSPFPSGITVCLYGIIYPVLRFVIEFYRGDLIRGVYGPFSTSQYVSIAVFCVSIWLLMRIIKENKERTHVHS